MTHSKPTLRLALCDDLKPQLKLLRPILESIVREIGFEPRVTVYEELAPLSEFLAERPQIVVVDNVFGGQNNSGIAFIEENKTLYPDIIFVLLTGNTFNVDQLGLRRPNPDIIATKSYISEKPYQKYLGEALFAKLRRYPISNVFVDFGLPSKVGNIDIDATELQSLVEQCIFEAGLIAEQETPRVQLQTLSGGYSGALIAQMEISGKTRWKNVPTVIKIAPRKWVKDELEAFQSFVRWQLPHTLRVDIVGKGSTNEMGAICYAFALADDANTKSAKRALQEGDELIVARVIDGILTAKTTGWYNSLGRAEEDLVAFLSN